MVDMLRVTVGPVDDAALVVVPSVVLGAQTDVDRAGMSKCSLDLHWVFLVQRPDVTKPHTVLGVRRAAPRLHFFVRIVILVLELGVLRHQVLIAEGLNTAITARVAPVIATRAVNQLLCREVAGRAARLTSVSLDGSGEAERPAGAAVALRPRLSDTTASAPVDRVDADGRKLVVVNGVLAIVRVTDDLSIPRLFEVGLGPESFLLLRKPVRHAVQSKRSVALKSIGGVSSLNFLVIEFFDSSECCSKFEEVSVIF